MTPGAGLAARAHPFTLFVVVAGAAALAFIVPAPAGPLALYALTAVLALITGNAGAVARAALVCLPLWVLLALLHGVGGSFDPRSLTVSREGLAAAAAQGARLGAVATASLVLFAAFDPSRFLDAVAERGWSFHAAYLVVATLQAAPRFRRRAAAILEAQRARGLRTGRGVAGRVRALVPLTAPLVLGMLTEADDRAMALEMRGLGARVARTPLAPPPRRAGDRIARWAIGALVVAGIAWRLLA